MRKYNLITTLFPTVGMSVCVLGRGQREATASLLLSVAYQHDDHQGDRV